MLLLLLHYKQKPRFQLDTRFSTEPRTSRVLLKQQQKLAQSVNSLRSLHSNAPNLTSHRRHHLLPLRPNVQRPQRSNDGQSPHHALLHLPPHRPPSRLLLSLLPLPRPLLRGKSASTNSAAASATSSIGCPLGSR
jgi:hypothetical protein